MTEKTDKTNAEVVEDLVKKQGPKDGGVVLTTKQTDESPILAGVDDPVRDTLGNLVDVNNDNLVGTHVLDGDLLLANQGQLSEGDAADIRQALEVPVVEPKKPKEVEPEPKPEQKSEPVKPKYVEAPKKKPEHKFSVPTFHKEKQVK